MRIMFLTHLPENPKAKERYAKIQAQLNGYASAGTQVELCFPEDYPGAKLSLDLGARNEVPGIYHVLQTPAIIRKIVWAEKNGYDAVVQSNTFDPGVEAARQAVRIRVIGVFRTALHTAAVLSSSIAIIAPLEEHIAYAWQIVRSYGMQGFVKEITAIGLYDETAEKRIDEIFARPLRSCAPPSKEPALGASFPSVAQLFQPSSLPKT
jgi:hypothetical protein